MELGYSGGIPRTPTSNRYSGQYSQSNYSESEYDPSETHSESGESEYHHHHGSGSGIPVLEYPSFLSQSVDSNNNNSNNLSSSLSGLNDNDEDLENVINNYISYEKDVDVLTERLGKTLSTLETEMIVGVLDSGVGVKEVISQLADKDGTHLTGVTAWIEYYNKQLQDMKKYIEHIEGKNNKMEIVSRNQKLLYTELNNLIGLMNLSNSTIATLTSPQFNDTIGLENAINAAAELKRALTTKLKSGMDNMVAVKDQRKVFETYKVSFARKVATLIENIFKTTDKESTRGGNINGNEEFPDHTEYYKLLNHFKPLSHWIKEMDHDKFIPLIAHYIKAYRPVYKKEVKDFFSALSSSIIKETKDQNDFFSSSSKKTIDNSLKETPSSTSIVTPSKKDQLKKRTVDATFRYALSCLEDYIMAKQNFLKEFFLYEDPPRFAGQRNHHSSSGGSSSGSSKKDRKDRKDRKDKKDKKEKKKDKKDSSSSPSSTSPNSSTSTLNNTTSTTSTTTTNTTDPNSPNSDDSTLPQKESPDAPLDLILTEMFDGIIGELKEIVEKADQINPFYHLTMLVDTEEYIRAHSLKDSNHSSFFVKILAEVQKTMKTLFNKFLDVQVESIKATQSSLKRCGVLPHFKNFHIFVKELEKYRSKNEEESITSLINSSYYKIVVNLYGWLDGLVEKLPEDDKYRFISKLENYYFFSLKMDELGIDCLKVYKETSHSRYKENLAIYINFLIDLKFKPLIEFYSKMDELLLTLPPSDIQFQQSHSKQQFKKIVEKFKTENIDKGLLKALTNIQKNISKDSSLTLVIWNELEKVFIEKYDHYQEITYQCYTQTMPVSSDQIRGIFATVYKKNPNKH